MGFADEIVEGPMARDVRDCALFLDAMAGYDSVWPLSRPAPEHSYSATTLQDPGTIRIAFAPDLGGFAPVESDIADVLRAALTRLQSPRTLIEDTCPDLPDLDRTFRTLRGFFWAALPGRTPDFVQQCFKDALSQDIAEGRAFSADDLIDAQKNRSSLYDTMRRFLKTHDVLACPVTGIAPGPVTEEYPRQVADQPTTDYIDWLRFSFLATTTGLPALSLPVGFTAHGLPVGLQLIGPPRGEARLLQIAYRVEQSLNLPTTPIDPLPARS